jgi:hypothetical protein
MEAWIRIFMGTHSIRTPVLDLHRDFGTETHPNPLNECEPERPPLNQRSDWRKLYLTTVHSLRHTP